MTLLEAPQVIAQPASKFSIIWYKYTRVTTELRRLYMKVIDIAENSTASNLKQIKIRSKRPKIHLLNLRYACCDQRNLTTPTWYIKKHMMITIEVF